MIVAAILSLFLMISGLASNRETSFSVLLGVGRQVKAPIRRGFLRRADELGSGEHERQTEQKPTGGGAAGARVHTPILVGAQAASTRIGSEVRWCADADTISQDHTMLFKLYHLSLPWSRKMA